MAARDDSDDSGKADLGDVAICTRTLNYTIGELARCYGAASVVVALTDVMACASCMTDSVERHTIIRALVDRLGVTR